MASKTSKNRYIKSLSKLKKKSVLKLRPLFKNFWLFVLILFLIAATQLTLFASPMAGIYVNALAFVVLLSRALWNEKSRQLAISAAILPAVTMLSLSLPQTSAFAQDVVLYSAILVLALVYRFFFTLDYPLKSTKLKLSGYVFALPLMIVIGQILGLAGYGLLRHQYSFSHTALPLVAATAVVFAIAEETLFRGLIQQRASLVLHPGVAAALSALLYTLFTFGHTGSWLSPFFGLIMGIALSITYYKKQNLILTIAMNASAKLVYIGLMSAFIFH